MNIGATGVIVNEYGEVLLIQRDDTRTWAMPGGSLDPGELPTSGVAREVEEETGLKVLPVRLVGMDYWPLQPDGFLIFSFRCLVRGGDLKPSAEALQVGYYNLARPPGAMFGIHRERLQEALTHSGGPVAWRRLPITPAVRLIRFLLGKVVYPFKDWRRRLRGEAPYLPPSEWRVRAQAIVRDNDGRVLWLKRNGEEMWQLPGGSKEEQEAPWETAVRQTEAVSSRRIYLADLAAVRVRPDHNEMVFVFAAELTGSAGARATGAAEIAFFAPGKEPPTALHAEVQMVAELARPREATLFSTEEPENKARNRDYNS
jgi:ADP-ribose pyrophosphatase YjhB (NUDIX family)